MKPLATSSTSPPSVWLDPHPRLDGLAPIDHLFNRLDGLYPHRWRSAFANDKAVENWRVAWADGLCEERVTLVEVRAGLAACRRREWPPSFAEFLRACRPGADPTAALLEAIEQMARRESGRDTWSHPAIYWAAAKIGAYDLARKTLRELGPEWSRVFGEQLALGDWPEIPERLPALPAPGHCHSREVGEETVRAMLALLRGQSEERGNAAA